MDYSRRSPADEARAVAKAQIKGVLDGIGEFIGNLLITCLALLAIWAGVIWVWNGIVERGERRCAADIERCMATHAPDVKLVEGAKRAAEAARIFQERAGK